jgi:hypothetical protein
MNAVATASVLVAVAALSCASGAAGEPGSERVRLVDPAPLTLRGVNFQPRERVSISLLLGTTDVRRVVRAGTAGQFLTVFPKLRYDRCHGALAVTAVGSRGSGTAWKIVPLECPDSADS